MNLLDHITIVTLESIDIDLFDKIKTTTDWDNSIKSRKTFSYGVPYNYSDIKYTSKEFPNHIKLISEKISPLINFTPNNCLINYYYNENAKMGYHSDQIDILEKETGIAIVSLGSSRIIRFKNKINNEILDIIIYPNSLFYMTQEIQKLWLHSILKSSETHDYERISLTFRKIK